MKDPNDTHTIDWAGYNRQAQFFESFKYCRACGYLILDGAEYVGRHSFECPLQAYGEAVWAESGIQRQFPLPFPPSSSPGASP